MPKKRIYVDNPDPAGPDIDPETNTIDEGGGMFGAFPYIPPPPDLDKGEDGNRRYQHPSLRSGLSQGGSAWFDRVAPLMPTAEQEALGRPLDSLLGNVIQGAGAVLLGGETPGVLNTAQQMVFGKVLDKLSGGPQAPEMQEMLEGGAIPNWYAQRQEPMKYRVPDTAELLNKGIGSGTRGLNKIEQKFYPGEGYPDYYGRIPPIVPVGENPPRPEDLIYHGLATDLNTDPISATDTALNRLARIQQEGLSSGWFSEQPHDPFGPLFLGVQPNDVWGQYPRRNKSTIDPSVEMSPYSYGGKIKPINPETTVSSVEKVSPEKLWLIDHQGNLLGRLAPRQDEPGYEDWRQSASQYWGHQAKPLQPEEEGVGPFPKVPAPTDPDITWSEPKQTALPFDEQGKMIPWNAEADMEKAAIAGMTPKTEAPLSSAQTLNISNKHGLKWDDVEEWAWHNKIPQSEYKNLMNSDKNALTEMIMKMLGKAPK